MRLRVMTLSWIDDDWDLTLWWWPKLKSNKWSLCKWLRIIIYLYGNEYKLQFKYP